MVANPHDALFKAVFGEPEHARGALRSMVPPVLAEVVDWSTLTLRPGSFVDPALREQHTDLLYSVMRGDGTETLVYFLFEHQSAPPTDGFMAFRLLRYEVRIWERWRADHREAKKLPMIVPIVMYHGATAWPEALAFDALLDVGADLRPDVDPQLIRFSYVLHDLSAISDDEIHAGATRTALARLTAMCFKHGRTRSDLLQILGQWIDVMREVAGAPNGLEALARVMRYILQVNEHVAPVALEALIERGIGPEAKEAIVTAGQQLIEQGRQEGRQEGRLEGRLEGRQESLRILVRQRFGPEIDADVERRIAAASLEQVEIWFARILDAATLGELLDD